MLYPPSLPRLALVILSVALTLALSTPAAEAQVGRFDGGGVVFGFNKPCRDGGWRATESYNVRYHPARLGDNGNRESITFSMPWHTLSFVQNRGRFTNRFQRVDHGGSFARPFFITARDRNAAQVRVTNRTPANLAPRTRAPVRIQGQIRNWGGLRGCNVRFAVFVAQQID